MEAQGQRAVCTRLGGRWASIPSATSAVEYRNRRVGKGGPFILIHDAGAPGGGGTSIDEHEVPLDLFFRLRPSIVAHHLMSQGYPGIRACNGSTHTTCTWVPGYGRANVVLFNVRWIRTGRASWRNSATAAGGETKQAPDPASAFLARRLTLIGLVPRPRCTFNARLECIDVSCAPWGGGHGGKYRFQSFDSVRERNSWIMFLFSTRDDEGLHGTVTSTGRRQGSMASELKKGH